MRGNVLVFGAVGLMVGILPALLVAGAYATWVSGGPVDQVKLTTVFDFFGSEPFNTGAAIGAGVLAVFGLGCAALGYRPRSTSHGSARWATEADLRRKQMLQPIDNVRSPIVGRYARRFVTAGEAPHVFVSAPTGAGKGVGVVIPTLLTYPGSVVALDVKGELFAKTSRHRAKKGDRIIRFSPYDPAGRTHRYNPLDQVASAPPRRRYTEARRLAASLIIAKSKSAEGFIEGAREIFSASALLAIEQGSPTIAAAYDLLSQSADLGQLFDALAGQTTSQEAQSVFTRMAGSETRVLSSYLSVLSDGGLSLWADPAVRDATSTSDIDMASLRRDPAAIYIVVSPNDLIPLAPLVRLFFQQTIAVLQRAEPGRDEPFPVLFMLDEFASLGRMDVLSQAITTLRSYGGRVVIIVQSLATIKDLYGADGSANLVGNCGIQVFLAPGDTDTADYVSRSIGDHTRKAKSTSRTVGKWDRNVQTREEGARLIRSEDLRTLPSRDAIILVQNAPPARIQRVRYYDDRDLAVLVTGQSGPLPEPPPLYPEDANPLYRPPSATLERASSPSNTIDGAPAEPSPDDPPEPQPVLRPPKAPDLASADLPASALVAVSDDEEAAMDSLKLRQKTLLENLAEKRAMFSES